MASTRKNFIAIERRITMGNSLARAVLSAVHAKIQRLRSIHKRQKIWFRDAPNLRIGTEIPYFRVGIVTILSNVSPTITKLFILKHSVHLASNQFGRVWRENCFFSKAVG
jgi:hypothetical protein